MNLFRRSLEHSLKLLREEQDETMAGQRGSRMAKWIQSTADARKKAGLSEPEKLKRLGTVWAICSHVLAVVGPRASMSSNVP